MGSMMVRQLMVRQKKILVNLQGYRDSSEHSHQYVYNRKICRIHIVLSKDNSHQFVYNCINLQICYSNCVIFLIYSDIIHFVFSCLFYYYFFLTYRG